MNIKITLLLTFLVFEKPVFSQVNVEAEYLKKNAALEIDVKGSELNILEHFYSEKAFYKNYEKHSKESVFYSDFDPISDFQATSLLPVRSGYTELPVSTLEKSDIVQPGIFYGGHKRIDFVFPKLSQGAIGRLQFTRRIVDIHLLSPFYFSEDINVKESQFSVTFPSGVNIKYILFGQGKENITFSEELVRGKTKKYTWLFKNVPSYNREKNSPPRAYIAPHIIVYVDSYTVKGKTIKVLSDVSDLYKWYTGLLRMIPGQNQAIIKEAVAKIASGATSDLEKTRSIFQWVQHNIKYIAFENGMAGFVPRSPVDVYEKRYGDCKDMAHLLKDMLNQAGIPAYHAWIGTRSRPYFYSDVPTALADDHMICCVQLNNEYLFLDPTDSFIPFGQPSSAIQDKEALIGISEQEFKVMKVPVVSRSRNQRADTLSFTIENDAIVGKFKSVLSGYVKDDLEVSHLRAEMKNDKGYMRDFLKIGGDNMLFRNFEITGLGKQDENAMVNFDFLQPGYHRSAAGKIYINLNLNKFLPGEKMATNREQPLEQDYKFEDKSITSFTIPDGYEIDFLPVNIEEDWGAFGVSSSYVVSENQIIAKKIFHSDFLYLDKARFTEWNELIGRLAAINQQSVILSKKKITNEN
jgi:transglutaminase-like putative cysteine protease